MNEPGIIDAGRVFLKHGQTPVEVKSGGKTVPIPLIGRRSPAPLPEPALAEQLVQ